MVKHFLVPIADREPLAWIVLERRTAFAPHRAREAANLEPGDVLFLYTTRGCFRNPTRDRGRVICRAVVRTPILTPRDVPTFGDQEYPNVIELEITSLAPRREGVELAPLIPRLPRTFPDPRSWSIRMRRALVPLDAADARLIETELQPVVRPYKESVSSYRAL